LESIGGGHNPGIGASALTLDHNWASLQSVFAVPILIPPPSHTVGYHHGARGATRRQ
jgi:hypothetical protein